MTSNNKLAKSERGNDGTGMSFPTCEVVRNRSARDDDQEFKVSSVETQGTNNEPRLPKGYRHIRSAVAAVLEYSGEHVSG